MMDRMKLVIKLPRKLLEQHQRYERLQVLCRVGLGLFSCEYSVQVETQGETLGDFVDRTLVQTPHGPPTEKQTVEGLVEAVLLEHGSIYSSVRIPGCPAVWVPNVLLLGLEAL